MGAGLLILRVVVGSLMAAHGAQKLFGWFGGYGLAATAAFLEKLGFRPARLFATAAALGEALAGVLVVLGFGGPIGPALMLSVMIVAAVSVHWSHGVFAASNGIELPLIYGAAGAALAMTGPGAFSIDTWLGWGVLSTPVVSLLVLAIAFLAASANLAVRRPPTTVPKAA